MDKSSKFHTALALTIFTHAPELSPDEVVALGLDDVLFTRLSELTVEKLLHIARRANAYLSINLNGKALTKVLAEQTHNEEQKDLENQFLYQLATNTMMRQLFGMHTSEFCARRRLLCMQGHGQHRPHYCDEETEIRIWQAWTSQSHLEERQRYLKVAEITGEALNVIWPAIQRHIASQEGE